MNKIEKIYNDTLEITHDADSKQDFIRFNAMAVMNNTYYENARFEICCMGGISLENYKDVIKFW